MDWGGRQKGYCGRIYGHPAWARSTEEVRLQWREETRLHSALRFLWDGATHRRRIYTESKANSSRFCLGGKIECCTGNFWSVGVVLCSRQIDKMRTGSKLWGILICILNILLHIVSIGFHQLFCCILSNKIINKIIKSVFKFEIQIYENPPPPKQT